MRTHWGFIIALCLSSTLFILTSSAPAQPPFSNPFNHGDDLILNLSQNPNTSVKPYGTQRLNTSVFNLATNSPLANNSINVEVWPATWKINNELTLDLRIGAWELAPEKIIATLEAAKHAIGKKPAAALLQKKFTQETGSRINTMIFEITPGYIDKLLTWGDVGEVLGDDGLLRFFQEKEEWHSVYFDVVHSTRGKLGYGAVRKWYMLGSLGSVGGLDSLKLKGR